MCLEHLIPALREKKIKTHQASTCTSQQLGREWWQPGHLQQALPTPAHCGTGMGGGYPGQTPAAQTTLAQTHRAQHPKTDPWAQLGIWASWDQGVINSGSGHSWWGSTTRAPRAPSDSHCSHQLHPLVPSPCSPSPGTAPALPSPPHQTPELALHSAPALPPDFIDGAQSPSWMDEELWPRPGSRKRLQTRGTKHISREMFLSQAVFTAVALRNPIREEEMSQVCTDTLHIQTFLHMRIYCIKKSDLWLFVPLLYTVINKNIISGDAVSLYLAYFFVVLFLFKNKSLL